MWDGGRLRACTGVARWGFGRLGAWALLRGSFGPLAAGQPGKALVLALRQSHNL